MEQMQIYRNNRDRILGIVQLEKLNAASFGHNVLDMLDRKLTFSEAMLHPDLWGYALFHDRSRHVEAPSHLLHSKEGDNPAAKKPSVKDIERELNGDK